MVSQEVSTPATWSQRSPWSSLDFVEFFSFVRCLTRLCWCLSRHYGCLNRLYGCLNWLYGCPNGRSSSLKKRFGRQRFANSKPDVSPAIIDKASSSVSAIISGWFARDLNESIRLERRSIAWRIFWRKSFSSLCRFGGDPSWCKSGNETESWREDGDRKRDLLRDFCLLWNMFSDFKYPEKRQLSPKRNLCVKTQRYSLKNG